MFLHIIYVFLISPCIFSVGNLCTFGKLIPCVIFYDNHLNKHEFTEPKLYCFVNSKADKCNGQTRNEKCARNITKTALYILHPNIATKQNHLRT